MKRMFLALLAFSVAFSTPALARDDRLQFDLEPFLSSEKAKSALLDVPLYFAGQSYPEVKSSYGNVSTNKKTNAFNKSDQEACEWVMLSALKQLQERALREGMNAVVNIKSNYKHKEFASSEKFECGAGNIIAGVALKADLVKI
ncbi:excinuclease ABC subunit A [Alteromonas flava]|uniref:excinuclease ABC subunit A n=1 Tax=Alteromonas flava TaxID=2048003 RepID=UPI000C2839DF|nr:excinuclease ABC subunit A [Alteromonas flava]